MIRACPAIDGIVEEGQEIAKEYKRSPALDSGLHSPRPRALLALGSLVYQLEDLFQPRDVLLGFAVEVTFARKARVAVTHIEARPERMHEDFRALAVEAMQKAWPCKGRGEHPTAP